MAKVSVEQIKEQSNYLRADLAADLANQQTTYFTDEHKQLLKFHGIYEQDDRDARKERKEKDLEPLYFFMVRSRVPGGKLTADQYLVHDEMATKYANGTIRLTSRQGIQFHGVFKPNLKNHIKELNEGLVTTLAACGDVNRNLMCCPAPIRDNPVRDQMQALADRLANHLSPRTRAYHELWLNGQSVVAPPQEEVEPIYGKHYLPRKFKTAIALPEDNCVDVLSNDVGFVVSHANGAIQGYNVYAGGGMGMTHGAAKTYPRLATPVCFASPDQVIDIATAIVKVQRDFGDRADRKQARLKYTIDRMGQAEFRKKVEEYYGGPLADHNGERITGIDDHLGWHEQGDGTWWVGIHILSGRIADLPGAPHKTTLRAIVRQFRSSVRVSATQNLLLCDIAPSDKAEIARLLRENNFSMPDELDRLTRHAMSCVATPTCGLAVADSERGFDRLLASIQQTIAEVGLSNEDIVLHMTGCPNGCARPFNSDIGLVGRSPGKYLLYLGGNRVGDALAFPYQDLVLTADIPKRLHGPLLFFKQSRQPNEGFGDFCRRVGKEAILQFAAGLAPA